MILESKLAKVLTFEQFGYSFVFDDLNSFVFKGIHDPVNQLMCRQLTALDQFLKFLSNLHFVEKSVAVIHQVHLSHFANDHLSYRHAFVYLSPIHVMEVVNDE